MTYGYFRWSNAVFINFKVNVEDLLARVPRGLELDLFAGRPFVSLVAFDVVGPVPRLALSSRLARYLGYQQLNVRTCVVGPSGPGFYLLDSRVDTAVPALGGRLAGMPYHLDRRLALAVEGSHVSLRARGVDVAGFASDVEPTSPLPGSIEAFLLDRSWTYGKLPAGRLWSARVEHSPWRARPVLLSAPFASSSFGVGEEAGPVSVLLAEPMEIAVVQVAAAARPAEVREPAPEAT